MYRTSHPKDEEKTCLYIPIPCTIHLHINTAESASTLSLFPTFLASPPTSPSSHLNRESNGRISTRPSGTSFQLASFCIPAFFLFIVSANSIIESFKLFLLLFVFFPIHCCIVFHPEYRFVYFPCYVLIRLIFYKMTDKN